MSASLVGSEMCIRDRCQAPPVFRPWSQDHFALGPCRERARFGAGRRGRCCLLYTSDAADDM
eukprot:3250526-Alexandrium_andersonii.AAC.1